MKEKVKIIANAVDRGTNYDTEMWFVSLDDEVSTKWANSPYWQGWIEGEVARALGFDWLDLHRAGHRFNLCRMTETLFAATLTRKMAEDPFAATLTRKSEGS